MPELLEVYKCEDCGNICQVLHPGASALECCGRNMSLLRPESVDAAREKHLPVIARDGDWVEVSVGSVAHPMTEGHYIEWIELVWDGPTSCRRFLKATEEPSGRFRVDPQLRVSAFAYCNLHGLWVS